VCDPPTLVLGFVATKVVTRVQSSPYLVTVSVAHQQQQQQQQQVEQ
jgi:hypothetical protein